MSSFTFTETRISMELCAFGEKGQPFVQKPKHGVDACYCMDSFK